MKKHVGIGPEYAKIGTTFTAAAPWDWNVGDEITTYSGLLVRVIERLGEGRYKLKVLPKPPPSKTSGPGIIRVIQ